MSQSDLQVTRGDLHLLSLFKSTNFDDVEEVLSQCSVLRVGPGKVIIAADQPNQRLYLVPEGELSVRLELFDNPPAQRIRNSNNVVEDLQRQLAEAIAGS